MIAASLNLFTLVAAVIQAASNHPEHQALPPPPFLSGPEYVCTRYGPMQIGPPKLINQVVYRHKPVLDTHLQFLDFSGAVRAGANDLVVVSAITMQDTCKTRLYVIEVGPSRKTHVSPAFGDCTPDEPQGMTVSTPRRERTGWSVDLETGGVRYRYVDGVGRRLGPAAPAPQAARSP